MLVVVICANTGKKYDLCLGEENRLCMISEETN